MEVTRNLVRNRAMTDEQARRLVTAMKGAFPEASFTGYEHLIDAMRVDPKDRHVAAVAVAAGAQVVVTSNLSDFRGLPPGIEAKPPGDFLGDLLDLDPDAMLGILREQAADLRRPPRTFDELLDGLARVVPGFVAEVRAHRRR